MNFRRSAAVAVVLFLVACLLPSVGMLFLPEESAGGNQTLAPVPSLTGADGKLNPEFLQEVTDYVGDHFAFRQQLITWNAQLCATIFHTSAEEQVVLGKDGWLFYRETLDDVLRTQPLSDRQLQAAARTLSLVQEYVEGQGARFLFTVAPNKATLYPQYLPSLGEPLAEESNLERLVPLLEQLQVPYADLVLPFQEQADVLYYRTDSHWNTRGAALAADTLLQALGRESAYLEADWTPVENHAGDLYGMLYPAGGELEQDWESSQELQFSHESSFHSAEDQRIVTRAEGQTGSILVFRDSFGNSLYPYLADSYGQALFSRSMPWQLSMLEETGADTVLIEIVERNLDWLTVRAPVFPAPERLLSGVPPAGDVEAAVRISDDGMLPGYLRMEGTLTGACDPDTPVYVQWGDTLYEASPAGEDWEEAIPFTLYIPGSTETADTPVRVYCLLSGDLQEATVLQESPAAEQEAS